jgi:predicted peptidase
MKGPIEFTSIPGPLTQKEIAFGIYLPEAYQEWPGKRFPVVYFLHGLKQDHTAQIEPLAVCLETAGKNSSIRH